MRKEVEKEEIKSKASLVCTPVGWLSFDKRFSIRLVPSEEDFKELLKG